MSKLLGFAAGLAMAAVAAGASAAPTFFAGTGHYYEWVGGGTTWTDALAAADAKVFTAGGLGYDGYLATVTTDAENNFLLTLANDGWLAGTDQAVEGQWRWAAGPETGQLFFQGQAPTGTTVTYSHWTAGEPNNSGNEDFLQLNGGGWNDLPNDNLRAYFVEYNAVPEPMSWALMIVGFAGMGAMLRRRRRAIARA